MSTNSITTTHPMLSWSSTETDKVKFSKMRPSCTVTPMNYLGREGGRGREREREERKEREKIDSSIQYT